MKKSCFNCKTRRREGCIVLDRHFDDVMRAVFATRKVRYFKEAEELAAELLAADCIFYE